KIATMFKETWTTGSGWNNYVLRTYFYDTNNNWTEKLTQLWDGSDWKNYYRHLATWLEPVGVQKEQLSSNSFYLHNNYPNPFNPYTKIKYFIPALSFVTIKVFDLLGKEVATLVNEEKAAGEYEIEFDGKGLSSGMYYYKLTVNDFSQTKKMILLR
ncbi:MAG: T9SS type A sorting domain-containing protein, partial [Ignavibacteriaceae bacterium]